MRHITDLPNLLFVLQVGGSVALGCSQSGSHDRFSTAPLPSHGYQLPYWSALCVLSFLSAIKYLFPETYALGMRRVLHCAQKIAAEQFAL